MTIHLEAAPAAQRAKVLEWGGLLLCMTVVALAGTAFAHRQTLWLDETTQLSGLSLGPLELTRWLTGKYHDFGCSTAPDRMPPLSYWLGQAWAALFGFSELSLRYFGVACVTLATGVIYLSARRAFGLAAALAAGLMVALAPAVIEKSVEIRAYPLYLLTGACATFFLIAALQAAAPARMRRALIGLVVSLIAMMYTHFIGVLGAAALLAGLFWAAWRQRRSLRGPLIASAITALAAIGLYPFVTASVEVSKSGAHWTVADRLLALGELFGCLVSHRVLVMDRWLAVVNLIVGLGFIAVAIVAHPRKHDPARPCAGALGISLAVGAAVVVAASFVFTAFKPAQYQYNLWMVPLVTLLLAACLARPGGRWWTARLLAIFCFLALSALGSARVAFLGPNIAHGPDPASVAILQAYGPGQVTVFYEEGSEFSLVQSFYPFSYLFHGRVKQYAPHPGDDAFHRFDDDYDRLLPLEAPTPYVMVLRSGNLTVDDVVNNRPTPFPEGAVARRLRQAGWTLLQHHTYMGMMKVDTYLFHRGPAAGPAASSR